MKPATTSARVPIWKQIAFGAIVMIPLIVIAEIVVRANLDPPGYVPLNHLEDPLYVPDPVRGYTLKPGAHSDYVTPDLDVDIDISADGLRDAPLADARRAHYRVLAVGDSFTMGLAVRQEDTWAEQLERLMNAAEPARASAVVNGGVPGYSPTQIRERLEELLPKVEPNVVVFGFVTETFVRMVRPLQLFGGTLVRSDAVPNMRATKTGILYSPFATSWIREIDFFLNRHWQFMAHVVSRIYRATHPAVADDWQRIGLDPGVVREHMQSSLEELARASDLSRRAGAEFVVLLINLQDRGKSFGPRQFVYNRVVADYCAEQSLVCVDVLPELDQVAAGRSVFRTPSDQHWTPAAHAIAAQALLRVLRR